MDDIERTLGVHSAKIEGLQADVSEIKSDMKQVLTTLSETKGGWKVLVSVGAISGSVGAFIGKVLPFWKP